MHFEDRDSAPEVRRRHEHLAVEAARAQQRLVEILKAIRRAHDNDLLRIFEAVEFDEKLVQRLILFAVETMARALRADRAELVAEDDRGRLLARLLHKLANACRAEAGKHLDERRRAS